MEGKLSEQLKHCLDGDGCSSCVHSEEKTILSCRSLLQSAYEKIKYFEDLEEQGLLLKLPCKVRDEFWVIAYRDSKITHVKCTGYCIQKDIPNKVDDSYVWIDSLENERDYWKLSFDDFKKQCFLTQAEAEGALKGTEREELNDEKDRA